MATAKDTAYRVRLCCGKKPILDTYTHEGQRVYWFWCLKCGQEYAKQDSPEGAADKWNRMEEW